MTNLLALSLLPDWLFDQALLPRCPLWPGNSGGAEPIKRAGIEIQSLIPMNGSDKRHGISWRALKA
ncbi:MAG: hypothetical protein VX836_13100 [Pseudomonadota bacterium]|nr:hypothetical protein [Pseudomonadota bacterium]